MELEEGLEIELIEEKEKKQGVSPPEDEEEEPKWKNKYFAWRNTVISGTWKVTQVLGNPEIILDDGINQIRLSDILGYSLPNLKLNAFIEDNELDSEDEFGFMDEDLMLKVNDSWKNIFDILDWEPLSKAGRYKREIIKQNKSKARLV